MMPEHHLFIADQARSDIIFDVLEMPSAESVKRMDFVEMLILMATITAKVHFAARHCTELCNQGLL